jgi:RNA recognition motif-containing protein
MNFQNYHNSDKRIQKNDNKSNFVKKMGTDHKTKTFSSYNQQNNMIENSNILVDDSKKNDKKFTGRCRLFVGNLPNDISETEFKEIFSKYGEIGEVFLNNARSFGFIKLVRE